MSWLVGAALLLLVALGARLGMVAYLLYVLVAVVVASRLLANRWASSLSAERRCQLLEARVGQQVAVLVAIRNAGPLPIAWTLLEDLLPREALLYNPPSLAVEGRRVLLTTIGPRGERRLMYQLRCNRRGYFQVGPLVMETGDLFGLHRRYRVAARPEFLLVLPAVVPLEGYEIVSRRPIGEVRMTHRLYEDPTRIAGIREYQTGDSLNRIHWRATARTGTLQCKTYEPSTVAGATLLLDFHRESYPHGTVPGRSELAITAAASIAQALFEMGRQVGLVSNARDAADRVREEGWAYDARTRAAARRAAEMLPDSDRLRPVIVETRKGPEQVLQIMRALARAELTNGLRLPQLLEEAASRMPRDATVLAILSRVTEETALALGGLRRRGFSVTVILNLYERQDFADAAGPLVAERLDVLQLRDEPSIPQVCRRLLLR